MNLKNKRVLVYGLGQSGRAVVKVLREHLAHVSFFDDNVKLWDQIGFERDPLNKKYDFVIVSPGVKCKGNLLLKKLQRTSAIVMSELDFGYLLSRGKVVAITGTNGKTTTCMLVYNILKSAGYDAFLCGNIGLPISAIAEKTTNKSILVCEVSNFQLELSQFFHANIACVLNIKPDHLDRHGSFDEYKRCKSKIVQNMKHKDVLILNLDDDKTRCLSLHKNFEYFTKGVIKRGTYIANNYIFTNKKPMLPLKAIKLRGEKNLENVLAAVSICSHFKVNAKVIEQAVSKFVPAQHRMEIVGSAKGVTYVDDSKATNVASTVSCLEAFQNESVILLLGGVGKEDSYDEIFLTKNKIKCVVCFGKDREKFAVASKMRGYKTFVCDKFETAVVKAHKLAVEEDFVLLSPACASFDEFVNYAERGDKFQEIVVGFVNEK